MIKLGVLGVGDLTEKMVRGLSRAGSDMQIVLSPRNGARANALASAFGCTVMASNQAVVDAADVVLIGVRPDKLEELAQQVTLKPGQPLVSVAGGVSVDALRALFGERDTSRAMLSYASEINRSTVSVYPASSMAEQLFAPLGSVVRLESEREFELATVGACMNGWFYFQIHALQQWLAEHGLSAANARELVFSSIEDCVAYSRYQADTPIDAIGRSIATPGTYTAHGLDVLREHGANAAWTAACDDVFARLTRPREGED